MVPKMKLPNADSALIPVEKLRDYLLSRFHPVGRSKARFFFSLGYRPDEWALLEKEIRSLVRAGDAVETDRTAYGQKYEVQGFIEGPAGRSAHIVTVWILLHGEDAPRFVTAHPGDRP